MGNVLRSVDDMMDMESQYGMWRRAVSGRWSANITSGTSTSGYVPIMRYPRPLTVPTLGAGVTAAYLTYCRMLTGTADNRALICAIEVDMGTLTVSTNVFADGSLMPTRTIEGSATQTASLLPMVVVTASLTATTPVLTITYKDDSGNAGNTCTMTLPTNALVNSAFWMSPHLANGDTGVQDISNISISTGSAGTLKVYGLLPLAYSVFGSGTNTVEGSIDPLCAPMPMFPILGGDKINFYSFGLNAATDLHAFLAAVPDN